MEEDQPKQRRARTPNPAFSTPDQPTPPAKPAKSPPAVTFRPPSGEPSSGTGANSPEAAPPPRPQGGPRRSAPRKAAPPRTPEAPAKHAPEAPEKRATPAKKAATAKAEPPAAPAAPAKAPAAPRRQPAKKAATAPVEAARRQPRKSAPAKAAATVRAVAAEVAPAVVTPDLDTVPDTTPAPAAPPSTPPRPLLRRRTDAWARIVADPGHSPELLALAAVQIIGPLAEGWARRTREAYPTATPDALARLAVSQFTRAGSLGSVFAAVAGSYAPLALLGSAALTHAELALHVAAAYGLDPADRARAVDLLVLTRVHPEAADAEAALAAALEDGERDPGLDAVWRLGRMAVAQAGGWAALRAVNRFFPGTSLLVATLTSRGAARALAARAVRHYSQLSQLSGSSV